MSSMLASPQGASEQYMKSLMWGLSSKGWNESCVMDSGERCWRYWEGIEGVERRARISCRKKWLRVRRQRISACQS